MTRLLHVGLAECSNIGDQAITDCIRSMLSDMSDYEYKFFRINFNHATSKSDGVVEKNKIKEVLRSIRVIKILYDISLPVIKWRYYKSFYNEARKSEKILIGGGNLLMDIDFIFPLHLLILVLLSRLAGAEPAFFLAGIGPLNSKFGRFLAKRIALRLKFSIVRDELSKSILEKYNPKLKVSVLPDPVFFAEELLKSAKKNNKTDKYRVLISVFPYGSKRVSHNKSDSDSDFYYSFVADIVNYFKNKKIIMLI
ncbi:polysaccharide pyruvyl transferase family protein [Neptunomonas japonica]|uniref:Polysaccharide pyruvyl transferase domain-containing protein n=1 Tax=Neptunomonas japonica JAMM 1380 TaxID=1441457 RepID=A0A7R6SUY8_9GAMM|nr:polysaccharide pyruvyl transferase family protein [Neptunomonas japonica]BBB28870.1 hypothetical protein NEJAP_0913 [Neptunomonas japonica JAMM 1380]